MAKTEEINSIEEWWFTLLNKKLWNSIWNENPPICAWILISMNYWFERINSLILLNRRNLIGGVPSYKTIEKETIERKLKSNLIAVIHFRTDRHAINANGSIYGGTK